MTPIARDRVATAATATDSELFRRVAAWAYGSTGEYTTRQGENAAHQLRARGWSDADIAAALDRVAA